MTISQNGSISRSTRKAATPLDAGTIAEVARIFSVLAEPTRLQMLQLLRQGPLYVSDLVARLGAKQANVSKQLGVLHQAGLVGRERDGIQVRYFIAEPMIFELCGLVCDKLRRDAEARLSGLEGHPRSAARQGAPPQPHRNVR